MQKTITADEPLVFRRSAARRWLQRVDLLFYALLVTAIGAFGYYLYYYLTTPLIHGLSGNVAMEIYLPFLLQHAGLTILISLVSMALATLLGFVGAQGRLASFPPARWLATIYVEVVRGTPVLVQLLFWYFGVAQVLFSLGFDPYNALFNLMTILQSNSLVANLDQNVVDAFFWGAIGLGFNYGAYLTEVFRSGLQSVDSGQREAALSLGLNARQTLRRIILPQALRLTLPPFTNYFITLVQDSALLSVLGFVELEQEIGALAYPQNDTSIKLFIFVLGALFYFVICFSLALLARFLESRFAKAYRG
jgi:His/Glu/Gln/Arg/opine family amino acid ABC transporter permease subunit